MGSFDLQHDRTSADLDPLAYFKPRLIFRKPSIVP